MALPVPESAAGTREDILRTLVEHPEGLSDRELAEALTGLHPGIDYKAVNHQCRKLVTAGAVERVGTKPVRTRLVPGFVPDDGSDDGPDASPPPDRPIEEPGPATDAPDVSPAPTISGLPPVQAAVLAALVDAPAGLTDNEIAAVLAPAHPDVDPKAFNYQCRKLVKAGLVERSARSKDAPIRTRITEAGREEATRPAPELPGSPQLPEATERPTLTVSPEPTRPAAPRTDPTVFTADTRDEVEDEEPPSRRPRSRPKAPSDDLARRRRSERAGDDPDETPLRFLPVSPSASVVLRERLAQRAALRAVPTRPPEVVIPQRDVLQGWSRTQNVAAAVATWLTRRGGTVRRATEQGPALDLVAALDGEDVHVEVTGWPPDGARTHPSTLAADWFRAAGAAAVQRRRAHPRSRVVIALPDTRRYRSLAADAATTLSQARAEVWFVDAAGQVQLS
ncbi:winged helix-turn-helix domain-containing protein [Actinomycetospora chiangmaiensis]|uniref:winged helix-turn-helix domain-containing protein n=1 Tax=Actinomycetospora chiangmaiensis TaxID=402650 RepID=UPI00035E4209|nr:MarR family transcriptional regulator [Actinomycetospora chiangmaiensis]